MSPTCTMVLLKLHCDVAEATLSAFAAMVSGGREGGSPTRLTEPPAETTNSTSSVMVVNRLDKHMQTHEQAHRLVINL